MRLDLAPRHVAAVVGGPTTVSVTITNTEDLISGYAVRCLGVDPAWVRVDDPEPTLFPGETTSVQVTLDLPADVPAGERRIAVQVRELTGERRTTVEELVVDIPGAPSVEVRLEPSIVTGGKRAVFGATVVNSGNTTLDGALVGSDAERAITFVFEPPELHLSPGEQTYLELTTSAKRRFTGSPEPRPFELRVEERPPQAPANWSTLVAPGGTAEPAVSPQDGPPAAMGAFVQKPVLGRGLLALLGLLLAVTIFAIVITLALSGVVQRSAADRDLAIQVVQAREQSTTTGTSSVGGQVRLLSTGEGVVGVSVDAFDESDTTAPVATTATDDSGAFSVGSLPAGSYKLRFRAAGFAEVWYPSSPTEADAELVTLAAGQAVSDLNVFVGGVPATVSGTVTGTDPSGAVVRLELPLDVPPLAGTVSPVPGEAPAPTSGAVVRTVPVGADGSFDLTQVPSPAVYDLVTTKSGYSTQVQRIDVAAGENRSDIEVPLLEGDGVISGTVTGASGPITGATVVATFGQVSVRTVTLTEDTPGAFTLRGLPTPGTFTVVIGADGYAPATLSLNLGPAQELTGVAVTLGAAAGTLSGTVTTPDGTGGVTVTITDGADTRQTVTQSRSPVGSWAVSGLRIPSTYTVTFSRGDLQSQVLSVSIDGFGQVTAGAADASSVDVTMRRATAQIVGTVTQSPAGGGTATPAGNVTISASSGQAQFTMTSASTPAGSVGAFTIQGLPPGTYTVTFSRKGTRPTSMIVRLVAGQVRTINPVLVSPASIGGVVDQAGVPTVGAVVSLYLASEYGTEAPPVATAVTNTSGRYSFADVDAPEFYLLEVKLSVNGAAVATSAPTTLNPSQQLALDITIPGP
ncbi:carboxypeptidase regulatory-like domain-containing protein [Actinotalea sp. M2MS4P-6]|uniref:carboxypeptidase regulatory-like domain-containing protein n=1 Tax=Actinotalea sp. M2MS4P-6 TaxID=2983762 RepID=UPI0021E36BA5|nr:carboxypeptidase regulatory-like domain-containing protein [Actinotalea sp. M2MS4P-6]MCV2395222.1 carboxypeptidase regulatory-like domain-containing protein [Actinotalea sp. M2MS4P-6]